MHTIFEFSAEKCEIVDLWLLKLGPRERSPYGEPDGSARRPMADHLRVFFAQGHCSFTPNAPTDARIYRGKGFEESQAVAGCRRSP